MFGLLKKKEPTAAPSKPRKAATIPAEFRYDREYCTRFLATNPTAKKILEEEQAAREEMKRYAQAHPYIHVPKLEGKKK